MNVKLTYNIVQIGPCNFWAIPKCGNTTIKYLLFKKYQSRVVQRLDDEANQWVHLETIGNYITPLDANHNGKYNFTVVRDPIERFKSLYSDFCMVRKDAIQEIKGMSVDQLITYISKAENEKNLNIHLRSQMYFLKAFRGDVFNLADLDLPQKLNQTNTTVELTDTQKERILKMWEPDLTFLEKCSNIQPLLPHIS
jgi:hypothetical protein